MNAELEACYRRGQRDAERERAPLFTKVQGEWLYDSGSDVPDWVDDVWPQEKRAAYMMGYEASAK